ncbi:MAG: uracil-DNA glycosylase [Pseudomonadales bacterium]|nr:uracil-DNA glycosylase [Pseudomonadales bacterium]
MATIQLPDCWLDALSDQFEQTYMLQLKQFLRQQKQQGRTIYPPGKHIFAAFQQTPVASLKLVILGQDPYHGDAQAHGLSFSVPEGQAIPPSLVNIYKEIQSDVYQGRAAMPTSGNLQAWAEQGVLLLNSVLTVEAHQAASHQGQGWEQFTDAVIDWINQHTEHLVFMLWGAYAQKKGQRIDRAKHLVLTAPHPSPLSAYRGFFGCAHFSQANDYLVQHGKTPVNWFAHSS